MRISDWVQTCALPIFCRDFCSTSASKVAVVASKTCGRAGESGDIRGIRSVFRPRLCQLAGIPTECKKYLTLAGSNVTCTLHLVTKGLHDEAPALGISGSAVGRGIGAVAAAGRPVAAARLGHRQGRHGAAGHGGLGLAVRGAVAAARRPRSRRLARRVEGLDRRSEEHTSELQSLMSISYAVFCFK